MKFKKMNIENYGPIEEMEFIPEKKIVAVVGKNGAGKSRFLDAIRFGLTGVTDCDDVIRKGCNSAVVQMTLEDDNVYQRSKNITKDCILSKSRLNGKAASDKVVNETFERDYNVVLSDSRVVVSAKNFAQLTPGELTDLIMSHIPEELTTQQLYSYLENPSEDMEKMLFKKFADKAKFGVETVKEKYKILFDERKTLKQETEKLSTLVEKDVEEPFFTKEEVEKEMAEIAVKEKEAKEYSQKEKLYLTALDAKKNQENELKKTEEELKKINVSKPDAKELESMKEAEKKCNDSLRAIQTTITTLENNCKLFQKLLSNLETPVCPFSEKLVCTTDKRAIKDETEKQLKAAKENISVQKELYKKCENKVNMIKTNIEKYRKQEKDFAVKVSLEEKLKYIKENPVLIPEKPIKIETENLEERKKFLNDEKRNIDKYTEYLKNLEELNKKKKELIACDALTKAMAPKGIVMMKIVDYYITTFENAIMERSKKLGLGYDIQLRNQNGLNIYCNPGKESMIHFNDLSTGEQTCTKFLILDMLNALTNTKVLILDEIQVLDRESLSLLTDLLCEVQKDYDHIFLAGVNYKEVTEIFEKHKENIQIMYMN